MKLALSLLIASLFFALTPNEALNEAVSRWGSDAFIRQTKTQNSYYWLYEVGKGSAVYGSAYGSYDKALGAAVVPELPTNALGPHFSVEPLIVEVDPMVCNAPTPSFVGTMPFDPACRRANLVNRARLFIEELCLANTRLCADAMVRYGVSWR